ncbi:hypothetical protein [Paenibacillus sp. 1A_MP2]
MKGYMIQGHNRWIMQADATEKLAQALLEAKTLEDQAVDYFRLISLKYPDRKRSTVPRWGAHSAR